MQVQAQFVMMRSGVGVYQGIERLVTGSAFFLEAVFCWVKGLGHEAVEVFFGQLITKVEQAGFCGLVAIGAHATEQDVFNGHGADVLDHDAALVVLASKVDILRFRPGQHRRIVGHSAEDDHRAADHATAHIGFDGFGTVSAGIYRGGLDR